MDDRLQDELPVRFRDAAAPYTPLAGPLGLVAPPLAVLAGLGLLILLYVAANEVAKRLLPFD